MQVAWTPRDPRAVGATGPWPTVRHEPRMARGLEEPRLLLGWHSVGGCVGARTPTRQPPGRKVQGMPEQQGTGQELSRADQLVAIAGDVAAIVKQAWGRGPKRTTAHWAGADALVLLMDDGQTDAERTLREARQGDEVLRGRRMLHEAVEARLRESVSRHTGR